MQLKTSVSVHPNVQLMDAGVHTTISVSDVNITNMDADVFRAVPIILVFTLSTILHSVHRVMMNADIPLMPVLAR